MTIDFNSSPEEIFKEAAVAHRKAALALEPAQKAFQNAQHNLDWVAAHPGLADIDKAALYRTSVEGVTLDEADVKSDGGVPDAQRTAPEPEAPKKRTRRTKAQIEADRKAEEEAKAAKDGATPAAATAVPANESDHAAQQVEGQGVSQPPAAPATPPVQAVPAQPAPAVVPATDPFDPFGVGA